jgi:hypothetical protein
MSKVSKFIVTCFALSVITGCSLLADWVTGPNRNFRVVGNNNVADFITFEGASISSCIDRNLSNAKENIKVGCTFRVQLVGDPDNTREVFCTGDLYRECKAIPIGARVSVNGKLMSPSVMVQANSAQWREE